MATHLNIVILLGTLTRDPEIRFTPKGTQVADFGLALNREWKAEDGTKKEDTHFIDCVAFAGTAKVIGDYVKKGHTITVEGRLTQDTWKDKKTGENRSKIKVTVDRMGFVSRPKGDDPAMPQDHDDQ